MLGYLLKVEKMLRECRVLTLEIKGNENTKLTGFNNTIP